MSDPLVNVQAVSVTLGGNSVLSEVSLTLEPGRITTLIGPNGAGKSTLARVVLGLVTPSSGSVSRRKGLRVGYMPQHIKIDDSLPLTVDRFLWLAASGPTSARRAALEQAGVAHLRRRAVQQLSGGEMQRVLLARALLRMWGACVVVGGCGDGCGWWLGAVVGRVVSQRISNCRSRRRAASARSWVPCNAIRTTLASPSWRAGHWPVLRGTTVRA